MNTQRRSRCPIYLKVILILLFFDIIHRMDDRGREAKGSGHRGMRDRKELEKGVEVIDTGV